MGAMQKTDWGACCRQLEQLLADERALRKAAERNAARFHALMLQARVKLITERLVGGDVT